MSTPTAEAPSDAPARNGFYLNRWLAVVIGLVIVAAGAVAIGFAVSDGGGGERFRVDGGRFGEHNGGGGHRLGIIVVLILIVLAITAAVLIVRRYTERSTAVKTSAERILAERFARGEIDEADYLSRRDALRS